MRVVFLLLSIMFCLNIFGQNRIITLRVIGEDFRAVNLVRIEHSDTAVITQTDIEGTFKIELPVGTTALSIRSIGLEEAAINLLNGCDNLDIILMGAWTYDFIPLRKVNKLRLKKFNKLPQLHSEAFQKGMFTTKQACYNRTFKFYPT